MSAAAIFAELSALIQLPPIPRPHSGAAGRDFRQHVVIIGGGFAGLASAVALRHAPVRMTLIDRRNYHLSPAAALPGPTTGRSPADIASPIRSILSRKAQCHSNARQGHWDRYPALTEERRVAYDQLVVATRARHAYSVTRNGSSSHPASSNSTMRPTFGAASCSPLYAPKTATGASSTFVCTAGVDWLWPANAARG